MTTDFKPIYKDHFFGDEQFGDWLFKVTGVDPTSPGPNDKNITDFTQEDWAQHMKDCKVPQEISIDPQIIDAQELVKELLKVYRDTGVLKGIVLPFETTKSNLQGVEKQHITDLKLNYGRKGVNGAQRMPKPRHVLEIIRKWSVDGLTVGLARKDPIEEVFYVNEGQHRTLAGALVGRREFALQYIVSESNIVDIIQFGRENQGKLSASVWEVMANNAMIIIAQLEQEAKRLKTNPDSFTYDEVAKICNISKSSDQFIDYKVVREIAIKEGITIINKESNRRTEAKTCSAPKQLQEIYSKNFYSDELRSMAVDIYLKEWRNRQFVTADLIGITETLFYNWEWIQKLNDREKRHFIVDFATALRSVIADKSNSKALWKLIEDQRKKIYPKNGPDFDTYASLYSQASNRISEGMWLATGFYEILVQHVEMSPYHDKLVMPKTNKGTVYKLGMSIASQNRIETEDFDEA